MASHIAVTPQGVLDSGIAIAACRAGEIGILDLGYCNEAPTTRAAIGRLAAMAGHGAQWGVRWDTLGSSERGLDRLAEYLPRRVPVLVLAGLRSDDLLFSGLQPKELAALKKRIKRLARRIFIEVGDLQTAHAAQASGCDGLILRGHECGGWASRHSSFVLLQELRGRLSIPYWVQGGMGVRSAAAAVLAGAAGAVLCEQLWLAEESPYAGRPESRAWAQLDGSETILVGPETRLFRLFSRAGRARLQALEQAVVKDEPWQDLLRQSLQETDDALLPMGEDIAFASSLARRYGTVGRILAAYGAGIEPTLQQARAQRALAPESALARIHGTRFPVVQGPMTRVSDVAAFAKAMADGGGLPFMALSVMRKEQVHTLLHKTKALLGGQPWGVGVLGFMPLELRQEQMEVVREVRPSFAIIAGGRPGQARELEALGIGTYLHVPSPGLLQGFIKDGARKFVFEGSECGGHTGPLTSFILWESAIETLLGADIADPEKVQVLFAGGIHDAVSAAMVSVLAAPLVARGMNIGVVMGSAYLFTREIVSTGAVLQEFQAQAIACRETTLLQSGKGMYTRCAVTPFCDEFNRTRRDLLRALEAPEKVLKVLELLNIGRLRIASKGISHNSKRSGEGGGAEADRYVPISADAQRREGMYMLGEVARLRDEPITIEQLHLAVSDDSQRVLAEETARLVRKRSARRVAAESDIAIVGMACLVPGAADLRSYWQNILNRVNAIREVGEARWRTVDFFDARRGMPDKVYSRWGGFIDDVQFDPARYGIPPAALRSIEPVQLLALDVARQALADAGFERHDFPRERAATIFASGGMNDLGCDYIFRGLLSHYLPKVPGLPESARKQVMDALYEHELPKWTEDSFAGILGNVTAGRVANRFDLRGTNFTVEAACASSLAALDVGVRQLRSHDADVALVGAIDATNNAVGYLCFAQTHALSPRGRCRPFDDSADGIALGEGVAALVLKRLGDAERDGDRIYAVIKGVGSSSDGRNRSMTAPHPQGQLAALRRAYDDAGVDPVTVELIEAHGTGTAVGDKSEIESLTLAFGNTDMARQSCAVGSVKSMIGHTKVTAGLASMVKTALALKHRVLPPTIGVETPNSRVDFARTPFFISAQTRPWLHEGKDYPRRAGVSAFGFGGTNFHVVMEEYPGSYRDSDAVDLCPRDAEPFTFWGHERAQVEQEVQRLLNALTHPEHVDLAELALAVHHEHSTARSDNGARNCRLALVATSSADLKRKLSLAWKILQGSEAEVRHPQGVYFREGPAARDGVCFLFPGQGSQRVDMLADLAVTLPALHGLIERADRLLADRLPQPLSRYIYPVPVFTDAERAAQQAALNATQVAQPALGVVELAALRVLGDFGIRPDFTAGHSYGEYVALHAAGVIGADDLLRLSEVRGRLAAEAGRREPGGMAAIDADEARVAELIECHELQIALANLNAADQTIVAGPVAAIESAAAVFAKASLRFTRLPVSAAFHSPLMEPAREGLAAELAGIVLQPAQLPVFSNTTGGAYPEDPEDIRALLTRHLTEPVRFARQIDALYESGARIFIEAGPGLVLSGLVDRVLGERPHATLAFDAPGRGSWLQLGHLLTQLFAIGVPVDLDHWFKGRGYQAAAAAEVLARARTLAEPGPMIWRVNGGRARPWHAPATQPLPRSAAPTPSASAPAAIDPPASAAATASQLQPARPATARGNNRSTSQERFTMAIDNSQRAGDAPAGIEAPALSQMAQVQEVIGQLIALQRDQQQTLRRFLDFQGSIVAGDLGGLVAAQAGSAHELPVRAASAAIAATAPRPALHAVPPAPVLPAQVVSLQTGAPAGGASAAASPAPAPAAPRNGRGRAEAAPEPAQPAAVAVAHTGLAPTAEFKADLLRAVADRTGYPEDMLDLDAHMEADLGIDSIKRIEVLSQLKDRHNLMDGRDEETVFEELTGLKTLNEIVAWYDKLHDPAGAAAEGAVPAKKASTPPSALPAETAESEREAGPEVVKGYVLEAVAAPMEPGGGALPVGDRPVLVVGPASDLATAFVAALRERGHVVWEVVPGKESRALGDDRFELGAPALDSVQALRGLLVDGAAPMPGTVLSLLGVPGAADGDLGAAAPAKLLFLLCKVFEPDLKAASREGAGRLLSLTALDGRFGLSQSRALPAAAAGTLGVAKSAAREWAGEVTVQCIDVAPELAAAEVVDRVLAEWAAPEPVLEAGYTGDGRWQLALQPQQAVAAAAPVLGADAVVLITGGAVGITAAIARALAAEHRPRLVLAGRSPLPEAEPAETRDIADPALLKQALIAKLRGGNGAKVKPADVDRTFRRLLKDREMRANLDALRATGAEVEYHAVDVRDGEAFGRLIDGIYARWGRIDGVIHGAGVIDDKLIRDKTPESFASVYDTKVAGAEVLARRLRPETLSFLLFFSSIAGRFGNAGQSDYAAANEVLNKLARSLGHAWPTAQVLAIDWGPWQSGMVGEQMLKFYAERGIHPIPVEVGVAHCLAQLRRGPGGPGEVVITASLEQIAEQLGPRRRRPQTRQHAVTTSAAA